MSKKSKEKNNDKEYDITQLSFKIITIGETGTGKTTILRKYANYKLPKHHLSTIGIDFISKRIKIDDKEIKLNIWDTAGQERYRNITTHTYKGADGIALIFDLAERSSFDTINDWFEQIENNTNKDTISIILIGNKVDLEKERAIKKEEGEKMAEEHGIKYFETSALNGEGINEVFEYLAKLILKMKRQDICKSGNITLSSKNAKKKEKKFC